eukprot:scaffold258911_cov33-Tisochrysis_lutea.AAC.1
MRRPASLLAFVALCGGANALAGASGWVGRPVTRCAVPRLSTSDDQLDALLKRELEAAFQGISRKVELDAAEEAQFKLIEEETQRVLAAVLDDLDTDGASLRTRLERKAAKMAEAETKRLMARADKTSAAVEGTIAATRATVLEEMTTLKNLKEEYDQIQSERASRRKSGLFGIAAFVAGLAYLSAGLNDLLRVVTGSSGQDLLPQGIAELGLGVVGCVCMSLSSSTNLTFILIDARKHKNFLKRKRPAKRLQPQ